ncbi:uncharacterized protein BCR38DRAFT_36460 [Pseudomassariella vexata]|uniref:Uncharacterized protein n=1 Tax=Pseudomassariella vexata TaxID=1141098 RepID=A0A1Y2DQG8_9PEZI|nr:uncharacterized protein BCR38DRAFT_36460 [Pseudomassariella vexata]ORY61532.1 hypothetical protein BCR38DRAFT_36460 [Pseudomassariella vexata]
MAAVEWARAYRRTINDILSDPNHTRQTAAKGAFCNECSASRVRVRDLLICFRGLPAMFSGSGEDRRISGLQRAIQCFVKRKASPSYLTPGLETSACDGGSTCLPSFTNRIRTTLVSNLQPVDAVEQLPRPFSPGTTLGMWGFICSFDFRICNLFPFPSDRSPLRPSTLPICVVSYTTARTRTKPCWSARSNFPSRTV